MKRYVREAGSSTVRRLLRERPRATCRLAHAEIASALARRLRAGDLSPDGVERALARLRQDLHAFDVLELDASLFEAAEALLRRHVLRAGDALHLAAALVLPIEGTVPNEMVCYDDRLAAAARLEGLRVRPRSR